MNAARLLTARPAPTRADVGCLLCYTFWSTLALVAFFWPTILVWIGGGIVVALVIGTLTNPIPKVEIEARHVHRPEDVLR